MVARLKLKGIDGRAHQEWSLRLNLTTRENLPSPDNKRNDRYFINIYINIYSNKILLKFFHDLLGGGAWPFLVGGMICLVNSVNERDFKIIIIFYLLLLI